MRLQLYQATQKKVNSLQLLYVFLYSHIVQLGNSLEGPNPILCMQLSIIHKFTPG